MSHVLIAMLLILFPLWDVAEARTLRRSQDPRAKSRSYLRMIAGLWAMTLLVLLIHPLSEYLTAPAGESRFFVRSDASRSLGVTLLVAVTIGMSAPLILSLLSPAYKARILATLAPLGYLLPRTPPQFALFAAVALSAGICEEVIYRGFLMRYLLASPWRLSLDWALVVSSMVFGIAHAGQGWKGVAGTALIGLILGALYMASQSLIVPIVLHAIVDLRLLALAMMLERTAVAKPN